MDNRGKRQAASIFGGMGFYIALLVCVVAAGVVGYFALLNNGTSANPDPEPVPDSVPSAVQNPEPAQEVSLPEPEPARPVIKETPVTVERPSPQPEEDAGVRDSQVIVFNEDDAPVEEPAPVEAMEPMVIVQPLAGETVAVFSIDRLMYDATLGDWRTHDGIDIQAAAGSAVVAASAGIVTSVEEDGRMGTTITVDHRNGYVTTYASLQPETSVLAGDEVPAGAVLGLVGNTSLSEAGLGAHLHFSVAKDGETIDPVAFLEQ